VSLYWWLFASWAVAYTLFLPLVAAGDCIARLFVNEPGRGTT